MSRYRVPLERPEPYRPDNRAIAEETLGDLVKAFLVLVLCIGVIVVWAFILSAQQPPVPA